MTDTTETFDDVSALEKMSPVKFYTAYNVRRPSQAPNLMSNWDKLILPTGSVFHTLNGLDTLVAPNEGLPDPTYPPILLEKLQIWLKITSALAGEDSQPFGVKDNFSYRPNTLMQHISHFYQTHRHFHRILSDRTLGTMSGVLTWVDYSPLNEVKVGGTLHTYRKFDVLFRTILDSVVRIGPSKYHYILLPQSNHVYARTNLVRTFQALKTGTLNAFLHDPSIFPIIHVLGYIYGKTHELDVTPYKEDVQILGKDDGIFDQVKSTSLLERLALLPNKEELFRSINFIFQKDNRAVVYNLWDIDQFAEDPTFFAKMYRHMMSLRLSSSVMAAIPHVDTDSDEFDSFIADTSGEPGEDKVEEPPVKNQETARLFAEKDLTERANRSESRDIKPTHKDEAVPTHTPETKSYEERVRSASEVHTTPIILAEPKKESRRNELLENHLKATIAGRPIAELIQPLSTQLVTPKAMDFLTETPEASYRQSSLLALDKAYQQHGSPHELAKVVGSLAKHGLYVSKVDEEKVHTEMDSTTTYRVNIADLNGKTHHVRFTLPDVDSNGNMKLGGVEYRLTRQIANIPICKISPIRVNLSSYYNKVIIERVQSKRFSYENDMTKLIMSLRSQNLVRATVGTAPLPTQRVAYDYTALGRTFTEIAFDKFEFFFGGNHAPLKSMNFDTQDSFKSLQDQFGAYVGTGPQNTRMFWDATNQIHQVDVDKIIKSWKSFYQLLVDRLGADAMLDKTPYEWTQANIINQTIPLVYILSYRFGLKTILDMIRLEYRFYPTGQAFEVGLDDIDVRFADGTLVFNRYPLSRSLIACGLNWAYLKEYRFADLNIPDTYINILRSKNISGVGVTKGLSGFFDFFVDPITETVLEKMHEPITFHELLLRANVMLTDYHSEESSSVKLHRFRLYERFNGIVYNEIYRGLNQHRNNPSTKKSFSINPEAVFQKIVQDATVTGNDVINPIHEVKQRANYTFTGAGGRTANSFVLRDRIYPKDGLGVVSDAVPDSGKVGITSYLSASPRIDDIHGIPQPYKDGDVLSPPNILAIGTMVMPGATTDDGKRASYTSIQISHYVPNHNDGETLAVRTGYDAVLPHLSSDIFAVSAEDNGVVEAIDTKQKVLRVRYQDKPAIALRSIKLPYLDTVLDKYRQDTTSFGYLIPDTEIAQYPMGALLALTKNTYGKIVDRLRCETVDAIPDKDIARKQNTLIQDFTHGKYKALYYIRFAPLSNTIPGELKSYSFKDIYSPISGAHLLQTRLPNVIVGEKVKTGDILIYNNGFFVPDPLSKQVSFKHGVTANVALIEKSSNHEDACEISRDLANRLQMTPAHQREIVTRRNAAILASVEVGQHVETSDNLCVISDDYIVGTSLSVNIENLDIVEKLNRQTPSAGYTGTVVKIRILYACDRNDLSDSLKSILKGYEKDVRDAWKALNTDPALKPPDKPGWVAVGTRYAGVDFTLDTVILEFMIQETLGMSEGDKLVISNAAKSIVSHVSEQPHYTASGIPIDMLFSTTSILGRIIKSPFNGIAERNMDELKNQALDMYFNN